jgi:ribosomal-protein-alanine N-acetyltransferase
MEWRNVSRGTLRQNTLNSIEDQRQWESQVVHDRSCSYFGIEALPESRHEIVGYCGLSEVQFSLDRPCRTAEWSLLIGPEYQGKGYATEALTALLNYGFNDLDLEVIWGEIIEGNEPCLRLAEKLGFVKEGVLRCRYYKNGERKNSVVVSLLKEEWCKRKSS